MLEQSRTSAGSNFRKPVRCNNELVGPIEKKMRATLDRIKDSKYEDTFDWSVYDALAQKLGERTPRAGVVFKTGLKLVNHHSSCSKCHYAFEIDTYGRGCTHNCVYCYAKEILTRHGYWNDPHPFPVNLAEIRKIFYTVFETSKASKWRSVLESKIPLRLGSMSDCFMWMDKKYRITQELIRILNYYQYPHIVFTRSDLVAHDDYLKLLDKRFVSIQLSIAGGNESLTRIIEPGAATVKNRLEALKKLSDNGFWTTVRINPLFPMYPDGYFTDEASIKARFGSKKNVPVFPLFDWNFIPELAAAQVPSVVVGVVRLTPFAIRAISQQSGIDYSKFFRPENFSKISDSRFSDSEIAFYYKKIQSLCASDSIRFNTCYIGNGIKDYYQYQDLWDNKSDCCDARSKVPSFVNSSQNIGWDIRVGHSPHRVSARETMRVEQELDLTFLSRANGGTVGSSNQPSL